MPRTHHLAIDPARPLAQQPQTGHNRWHEDFPPALEVAPGDTVILETRDAFDGQLSPTSSRDDVGALNLGPVHPLTGPVYVQGAHPGDLLEVKLLDVDPDPFDSWGYTVEVPGFGFLRDAFPEPFIAHWHLTGKLYAESDQLPGVRIIPPRETGGNIDIKQLTPGVSLLLPVYVEGALFSTGDVHYAQGDCEACGTAIEMRSAVHVQFRLHKGEAQRRGIRDLQFFRDDYFGPPELATPRRFFATSGISVTKEGENRSEDLTLAARNALLNMIEYLGTRGYDRQQAYALCSVAVDLRISQVVDVPNFIVTALLPLDIFV